MFRWGLAGATTQLGAIVLGVYLGSIKSVAICYTVANLLLLYPVLTIPGWLIDMSFMDVMKAVCGNFVAALTMASGVYALGLSIPAVWSSWIQLTLQVGVGVGLYWVIAHVCNLAAYQELLEIGKERWDALRESRAATQSPT
jgi:hypothetical protein